MHPLQHLAPVSLDELVTEAAFLTRVDRKYVVPAGELDGILAELDPDTRVLDIDGRREFAYESVYFDTPDLLSFHLTAHPRRRRFKVRTRTYLDAGSAYLELKTRGARGATVKERMPYDPARRAELTAHARTEVGTALASVGVAPARAEDLGAVLTTRYRRTTLLAPGGVARATVDTALAWAQPDGSGFTLPRLAVVETKSGSSASAMDRLLWRAGHRPQSISKFATGLAALHPELPRNRWARLLRGPFAIEPASTPSPEEEP